MASPVALIQGASRGLGLQYCKSLLHKNCFVVATCRSPEKSDELKRLQKKYVDRMKLVRLDVTDATQIQSVAEYVSENVSPHLDLLVNCAAILHPSGKGETSLREVNKEGIEATFATNAVGPLLMAKYFAPLLQKGQSNFGKGDAEPKHSSILVNLSAKVGSITDNGLGGWYSYRMSKAALNMATKNLSIELGRGKRKVVCVAFHPGTVNTDLSRPYHKNVPSDKLFTPEYSVNCHLSIIDNLDFSQTGCFFSWDGTKLPY